jgi:5'-nucleotidase
MNADVCIINSGTLRSDCIHRAGPFKMRDLKKILPFPDPVLMLRVSGRVLHEVLENGVSQYPKLEGRFPQVGGIQFEFDPSRQPGDRININSIRVRGEPLDYERDYNLATKTYLKDGLNFLCCQKNIFHGILSLYDYFKERMDTICYVIVQFW